MGILAPFEARATTATPPFGRFLQVSPVTTSAAGIRYRCCKAPEALMRTARKSFILTAILAPALVCALAQTASIDPALLAKANAGDSAAQVQVGESYAAGKGVAQDYKQAAEWYRKAAEHGDAAAQVQLAALYRDGKGVARDMAQAAEWYRKAAEQGDVTAQGTLGLLYSLGQGVRHDDVEAYYWLDLAAAVKGPKQETYAANRQLIGTRITADELDQVKERVAKWLAAHPR
jgi:TPR repeat protein